VSLLLNEDFPFSIFLKIFTTGEVTIFVTLRDFSVDRSLGDATCSIIFSSLNSIASGNILLPIIYSS